VETRVTGLTSAEAAARLKAEGYNELPSSERRGMLGIALEVIRQPMFALLIAGGLVYLLLGELEESIILLVLALLSVAITIVQETRSENVLETLRNLASPRALVLRNGEKMHVAGREVVRGDVIFVAEGDRIAADARLLSADDLLADESLLTGESVPVRKHAGEGGKPVPGGEDLPFVFSGTLVVRGTGTAEVFATGPHSEMGKIGHALHTIQTEQPHLQKQLHWLVRDFAIVAGIAGALVVILFGLLRGSWLEAVLGGIAIGMSLLPEEFPLVTAVFMAMGAWRISRAKVLTRRAAAIETLGATTVLCTDKTGTLTENRQTVVSVTSETVRWTRADTAPPADGAREIIRAALLATPRDPSDPMDLAVHAIAHANGISHTTAPLRHAYGLRPDLFAVADVYDEGGTCVAYAKGAFEAIAELCQMPAAQRERLRQETDRLGDDGIRVLAVAATQPFDPAAGLPETPRGLPFAFVGLAGFADPLRAEVPAAVEECRTAGVRVLMITGDYPATARAIAEQAGIGTDVLTGDDINVLSDAELARRLQTASVLARVRPQQKLRIVESLKANGEVVAMTGDGVNDAPAIKAAHIGIAMGGRGTDVAREASAIVLLDDNFGSIVTTIRLGRRIYDNLRKAIEFIVAVHIPIAGLAILPLLAGFPLILTPIHIAFLEMVIDPACSVVLEAEEAEADVMRRPPRDPGSPLLLPHRVWWALLQGLTVFAILGALLVTTVYMGMPEADVRALVFSALVLANVGLILVNRSFDSSVWRALTNPNPALRFLLAGVAVILGLAIFFPPVREIFRFGRLHWDDLAVCVAVGALNLLLLEKLKAFWFRSDQD
jgi:Ca2+-transporting ATPase